MKPLTNPGCRDNCGACVLCTSALPYGASCAASCQHAERCRRDADILGSEGHCRFSPSQYLANVPTPVDIADRRGADLLLGVGA